jgi:hypothetical protein
MSKNNVSLLKKPCVYIPIITFIIGLFLGPFLDEIIKGFVNRPKLHGKIQKVVLTEEKKDTWKLSSFSKITNSGNSNTYLDFKNLEVFIPEYSSNSLVLPISEKKNLEISSRKSVYDTTSVDLPFAFKLDIKKRLPDLKKIQLNVELPKGLMAVVANSSDIVDTRYSGAYLEKPSIKTDYNRLEKIFNGSLLERWDEVEDSLFEYGIEVEKFYVVYKGKKYFNYLFPPKAEIEYDIKDDRIFVTGINFDTKYYAKVAGDTLDALIPYPLLFPHPEIRDKIVLPEFEIGKFVIARYKDDKTYIDYHTLNSEGKKEITYIFE